MAELAKQHLLFFEYLLETIPINILIKFYHFLVFKILDNCVPMTFVCLCDMFV